jgi:hypothetical protein
MAEENEDMEPTLADIYAEHFKMCPICGGPLHENYVRNFANSTVPAEVEYRDMLNSIIEANVPGVTVGIPCCECFTKTFNEPAHIAGAMEAERITREQHYETTRGLSIGDPRVTIEDLDMRLNRLEALEPAVPEEDIQAIDLEMSLVHVELERRLQEIVVGAAVDIPNEGVDIEPDPEDDEPPGGYDLDMQPCTPQPGEEGTWNCDYCPEDECQNRR